MYRLDYTKRATEDLAAAFADAARELGEFRASSQPQRANDNFDQMTNLYAELRRRGLNAQRQLLSFLESDNPHVRLYTAAYALDFDPEKGLPVLERILQHEVGLLKFSARATLERWYSGEIRFFWMPR